MRNAFVSTLCNMAREDDRIWLLCGDLGYSVLEPFIKEFPDRFVNVGVAEQNMIGVAAGLAMTGKTVFVYSIANFPTLRCYEQIRNDVCYHNANVKVVSIGGGLAYGSLGYTHFGVEDLGVMRILPNMIVCAPGDPTEASLATRFISEKNGPCYLRLGKAGEKIIHHQMPDFQIGKAIKVFDGDDIVLFTTGGILSSAIEVRDILMQKKKWTIGIFSFPFIVPFDHVSVRAIAQKCKYGIVTIEEHGAGGLESLVAEVIAREKKILNYLSFKFDYSCLDSIGSQDFLRKKSFLSSEHIANKIIDLVSA